MRKSIQIVSCVALIVALAGCPLLRPADSHTLTLTLESVLGGRAGMEVYVVVDDVGYTRTAAPLFDSRATRYVSDSDPSSFEQEIPTGAVVTLVAIEFRGVTSTTVLEDDPEAFEFASFEGDFDDTPEDGVATVTMDGDKSISAVFDTMPRFVIHRADENNTELGGGCFDFTLVAAPLLGLPNVVDISGMTKDLCTELSGFVKTGTRLTLAAVDDNGCDQATGECTEQFQRWEGSAASCGTDRTCTLVINGGLDATAVWRDTSQ